MIEVSDIPEQGFHREISATAEERSAIAERLGVADLAELAAQIDIMRLARGAIRVNGTLAAAFTQTCVVSLDEFSVRETVAIDRTYVPARQNAETVEELFVDPLLDDDPDPIIDDRIDLGELAVETLALALDPYPRSPGAEFVPQPDSDRSQERSGDDNPFSVLAKLNPNR